MARGAAIAGKVDPRGGAEHAQLRRAEEIAAADEDPARMVDHSRLAGGENGRRHLVAEGLQIGGGPGVQDDEVHHHPPPAPVLVRGEELPQGWQPLRRVDGGQENRPVPREPDGPEHGLGTLVGEELRLRRAQLGIGEEERACELLEDACVHRRGVQLAQLDLRRVQARSRARCAERGSR